MSINNIKITNGNIIKKIDIRGKVCPMTFVYTKLALEKLNTGDTLEVLLDFRPALKSIPENCKRQDLAKFLNIEEIEDEGTLNWLLKLRKI
ncbi:MAG: sulfurtransferase TusA family protein [Promethearchaeota archaeon]